MLESFEHSGIWWLPEKPEKKIHGKLSYDPRERPILSLDGAFYENLWNPDERDFHEIILGDCYGKKITLRSCFMTHCSIATVGDSSEKYVRSEFGVNAFYIGYHFNKKEDIKFTQLYVRYSDLEEWLGERPFRFDRGGNEEGLKEVTLRFAMPNMVEISLERFKIRIGYGVTTGGDWWRKPEFETNAWVSIDVSDEMHVDKFLSIAYHLKSFLTLATGNDVLILTVSGKKEKKDGTETVQIFYHKGERISAEKLFRHPFFPFGYKSISERPEFYLQNWFNIVENLEPTYDLFFGTIRFPYVYPRLTFLSLAQALESYHSRTSDNQVMTDESFRGLLSPILDIIRKIPQSKLRQHFTSRAEHMHRKTLRMRINELFVKHDKLFSLFINNKNKFIEKVVNTRNYYTHYDKNSEKRAAKVLELPFLSDKLRFMLIVILLKEIGFDDKVTEQALREYMRFTTTRGIYE
jgi:hypothetical protein